jgi:redox-sensitive bicupin YhaK (pirin superfamily)
MPELITCADKFHTSADGIETTHSFSYGAHYDPARINFGPIMAINFERLAPGAGYDAHKHSFVEIVTWVLEGALLHQDTTGTRGIIEPGTAQRLSAGEGVEHSERNASDTEPLTFVQMMLRTSHEDEPQYAQVDVAQTPGQLNRTVSLNADAELFAITLDPDHPRVTVPALAKSLVIVTSGTLRCDGLEAHQGDELRFDGHGQYDLSAHGHASALIWQLN